MGNIKLLSLEASTVADRLNSYVSIQLGFRRRLDGLPAADGFNRHADARRPLLVLYLFAQRSFVESIAASGIKG
ncbi:MAG: hypothetical protein ACLT74_01150 [Christensenellales bacterium]